MHCEGRQNVQKIPRISFLLLTAIPFIEVRLYLPPSEILTPTMFHAAACRELAGALHWGRASILSQRPDGDHAMGPSCRDVMTWPFSTARSFCSYFSLRNPSLGGLHSSGGNEPLDLVEFCGFEGRAPLEGCFWVASGRGRSGEYAVWGCEIYLA
jgi:hypothetical protein